MKCGVEGVAGTNHTEGDLSELAHHGADDEFWRFAVAGQALAKALTPLGFVQGNHRGHIQGAAQEGMSDLRKTRSHPYAAAGFMQSGTQAGEGDERTGAVETLAR